jgi:hypothetical protein
VTSYRQSTRHFESAARVAAVGALLLAAGAGFALAQTAQPALTPGSAPATAAAPATAPPPAAAAAIQPATGQNTTPAAAPSSASAFPPQPPPAGAPAEKRGFLNEFGQWWDKSVADFNAKLKEQQTKADDFNKQSAAATKEAMKNAADALRIPVSKIVEMHEVCATAGNGAPDCASAVTKACQAKGFKGGDPVDIRTAEKCSASLWVSGSTPPGGDCPNETVVLRAACQQ